MAEDLGGKYTRTGSQEHLKEEGTLQSQGQKSADEVQLNVCFIRCHQCTQ